MANTLRYNIKQHLGIGMVEVLVTLFVLAIGLLGVASLQFVGSFSNSAALQRSSAVMVSQQLTERLQASAFRGQGAAGPVVDNRYFDQDIYNFETLACAGNDPWVCHCEQRPAVIPDCENGQCDSDQMAQFDGWQVSCATVKVNPAARVSLTCRDNDAADAQACSAGSIHQIRITWPAVVWQGLNEMINPACNPNDEGNDCVYIELVL